MSPPSADPTSTGVGKYATLVLLIAVRRGVTHVRIRPEGTAAIVELWEDAEWSAEPELVDRSIPLHMPLVRTIAAMLQGAVPGSGRRLDGSFTLQREGAATLYVHGRIEHDFEPVILLELVEEAVFGTRPYQPPP